MDVTGDSWLVTRETQGSELADSTIVAAKKQMGDGDENDSAERCSSQGVEESAAKNSKLDENPAA